MRRGLKSSGLAGERGSGEEERKLVLGLGPGGEDSKKVCE